MKRLICYLFCLILLFSFSGCNSDTTALSTGIYYAVGDYEELLTPYLSLDTNEKRFTLGGGSSISYAEYGTYEVIDSTIVAASQSSTFKFSVKDSNTLILIDNGDNAYFKIPANTKFLFSEDVK